jgi:hypothetical protein
LHINLPLKTLTRIFCLFFSCCKLYMLILPPHITIIWGIICYFSIKKWYLKSLTKLCEDEIWHLNSENCNLNMKFGIWILNYYLLFNYENWYPTSKNSYLNLKSDIWKLKIIIWIKTFEFQISFFFGIQNLIFQSQNWYLSS